MPRRSDLQKIMIIGSGPIVIGQACEFDYSGTQAIKALKEEGYHVILINSNPATIMTDQDMADQVYIEPITLPYLKKIIEKEKPDAILPTVGGQTALNAALELEKCGILKKYGVDLIGAKAEAIEKAEDRKLFKAAMEAIGMKVPASGLVHSMKEAHELADEIGFPLILRPSFTLGGTGGGVCYNREEYELMITNALSASPTNQVLVEQSVLGWKEYELEVMRDLKDNVVIICSIENVDPMGVHTGDSVTVAPQQTLSDKEYQKLRDASIAIIREIGVETGGSNIQFAVNPKNGDVIVIEMNPRVSRSSALASKATGFPIAKIAAKLSIGYSLDEIPNDITKKTPSSFEPTIDYIVTKFPRFTFEKFPESNRKLDTQMRSVGEAMALGRSFPESFQKAIRSLEIGRDGWGLDGNIEITVELEKIRRSSNLSIYLREKIAIPTDLRLFYIREAFLEGFSIEEIYRLSHIDPWFLGEWKKLIDWEKTLINKSKPEEITQEEFLAGKKLGYSDRQIAVLLLQQKMEKTITKLASIKKGNEEYAVLTSLLEDEIKDMALRVEKARKNFHLQPIYKRVDTCAAEFSSYTPYLYSTYEIENEAEVSEKEKVLILGSGPNRIGQGIEFDYCCCHASFALQELGFESIMINSNPETVSTDYDSSDRLYFEPIVAENILRIYEEEKSQGKIKGIILQFGGQTPLKLATALEKANIPILGTSSRSIHRAEDRDQFNKLVKKLNLCQPKGGMAVSTKEALEVAKKIAYPVLVRPSYVIGGRAMMIVNSPEELSEYMEKSTEVSKKRPVLIDQFLQDAIEFDVDALADGEDVYVAGILEHIEAAGVHSGDSACIFPPTRIAPETIEKIKHITTQIAQELNIIGAFNIQFAAYQNELYIIEVNPRASRTLPFISKALGIQLAKIATRLLLGEKIKSFQLKQLEKIDKYYVKEVILPFKKFIGVDTILGPEMKSTGEVMGIGSSPSEAFYKAQEAIYLNLPKTGKVFVSVSDQSKEGILSPLALLAQNGFTILATRGTAQFLEKNGIRTNVVNKVHEGRPHIVDSIKSGEIAMIVNIPTDPQTQNDSREIRMSALQYNLPYFTTIAALKEASQGINVMKNRDVEIYPLL